MSIRIIMAMTSVDLQSAYVPIHVAETIFENSKQVKSKLNILKNTSNAFYVCYLTSKGNINYQNFIEFI